MHFCTRFQFFFRDEGARHELCSSLYIHKSVTTFSYDNEWLWKKWLFEVKRLSLRRQQIKLPTHEKSRLCSVDFFQIPSSQLWNFLKFLPRVYEMIKGFVIAENSWSLKSSITPKSVPRSSRSWPAGKIDENKADLLLRHKVYERLPLKIFRTGRISPKYKRSKDFVVVAKSFYLQAKKPANKSWY